MLLARNDVQYSICIFSTMFSLCRLMYSVVLHPEQVGNSLAQVSSIAVGSLLLISWGLIVGQGLAWVVWPLYTCYHLG
jgi:hypothetical protein